MPLVENKTKQPERRPQSYFPFFDPPLRPLTVPWHMRLFQHLIFISKPPMHTGSPFDHEGEKPECYAKHARVVLYQQPPFDPHYIIDATKKPNSMFRDEKLGTGLPVCQIDSDTVVKIGRQSLECEALNMLMIQSMTSIPVPKVKQLIVDHRSYYLVIERINGRTLEACWSQLGLFAQLRIAWTLRGYVSQLRRLQRSVPGRIDGSVCEGYLCTEQGSGPFSSYSDFTSWYNHKLEVVQRVKRAPLDAERFDSSWPLVFTHGDINPGNIIMAEDGTLFLIDWNYSGFFPIWHEYSCMEWYCWQRGAPRSWRLLVPFISGAYSYMNERIKVIAWAITVGFLI